MLCVSKRRPHNWLQRSLNSQRLAQPHQGLHRYSPLQLYQNKETNWATCSCLLQRLTTHLTCKLQTLQRSLWRLAGFSPAGGLDWSSSGYVTLWKHWRHFMALDAGNRTRKVLMMIRPQGQERSVGQRREFFTAPRRKITEVENVSNKCIYYVYMNEPWYCSSGRGRVCQFWHHKFKETLLEVQLTRLHISQLSELL